MHFWCINYGPFPCHSRTQSQKTIQISILFQRVFLGFFIYLGHTINHGFRWVTVRYIIKPLIFSWPGEFHLKIIAYNCVKFYHFLCPVFSISAWNTIFSTDNWNNWFFRGIGTDSLNYIYLQYFFPFDYNTDFYLKKIFFR